MQLLSRVKLSQLKRKKRHLLGFNYTNSNFDLYLIYCKRNATTAYRGEKSFLGYKKKKAHYSGKAVFMLSVEIIQKSEKWVV